MLSCAVLRFLLLFGSVGSIGFCVFLLVFRLVSFYVWFVLFSYVCFRDCVDSYVDYLRVVSARAIGYVLVFFVIFFLVSFYLCHYLVVPCWCVRRYSCTCYVLTVVSCARIDSCRVNVPLIPER